jgi:TPP-dependent pyruvate/acetoin dehydrogenase alpha subunit
MRDPAGAVYRTRDEVDRERQRDPIALFADRCRRDGLLTEPDVEALQKAATDLVDEAVAFADASEPPPPEWLLTDVYQD